MEVDLASDVAPLHSADPANQIILALDGMAPDQAPVSYTHLRAHET